MNYEGKACLIRKSYKRSSQVRKCDIMNIDRMKKKRL